MLFAVIRKRMYMMLALVVLELMVQMALADYISARASEQEMQEWATQEGEFVVFPSSNTPTLPMIQPKMDQDLAGPTKERLPINLSSMHDLRDR
jgi:hypothetical protein